jgi:hypothetical protein
MKRGLVTYMHQVCQQCRHHQPRTTVWLIVATGLDLVQLTENLKCEKQAAFLVLESEGGESSPVLGEALLNRYLGYGLCKRTVCHLAAIDGRKRARLKLRCFSG